MSPVATKLLSWEMENESSQLLTYGQLSAGTWLLALLGLVTCQEFTILPVSNQNYTTFEFYALAKISSRVQQKLDCESLKFGTIRVLPLNNVA